MNFIKKCKICCRFHKTGITANSGQCVIVDGMAKQICVSCYRLPPYHREINLIELVQSEIKRHVIINDTQFSASFTNSLIGDTFDAFSVIRCNKCCRHVERTEQDIGKRTVDGKMHR